MVLKGFIYPVNVGIFLMITGRSRRNFYFDENDKVGSVKDEIRHSFIREIVRTCFDILHRGETDFFRYVFWKSLAESFLDR